MLAVCLMITIQDAQDSGLVGACADPSGTMIITIRTQMITRSIVRSVGPHSLVISGMDFFCHRFGTKPGWFVLVVQ